MYHGILDAFSLKCFILILYIYITDGLEWGSTFIMIQGIFNLVALAAMP
jgi:hypothetical protein